MQAIRRGVSRFGSAFALFCALGLVVTAAAYGQGRLKWQYTALGDSLAVGVFAFSGYVPRYQQYMQADTGAGVSLRNLAQNGWTSGELLTALRTDGSFRRSVRGSQVVTWDIGGNDLRHAREAYKAGACGGEQCLIDTVTAFASNWDAIVSEILALRGESAGKISKTIIRTMDLYNPYVAEDQKTDTVPTGDSGNDFVVFSYYLKQVNDYIAFSAATNGIPYAPVHAAFNGSSGEEDPVVKGYIAFDGLHPNDMGHKVMADLLRALEYAPLSGASAGAGL